MQSYKIKWSGCSKQRFLRTVSFQNPFGLGPSQKICSWLLPLMIALPPAWQYSPWVFTFSCIIALFFCLFFSSYHVKQCADFYNVSAEQLAEAVAQTNEYYGGFDIRSSKIVLPNGSIDPWHILGITQGISADLPAVFVKGGKELRQTAV